MDFEACTEETSQKVICLKENKSKFIVNNPNQHNLKKTRVDECLIGTSEEKCDWIVSNVEPLNLAYFIELKGCDIKKAISQLANTMRLTNKHYSNYSLQCYIVSTRMPKANTSAQKIKKDFYNKHKVNVDIKNIQQSVTVP
uniref:Uncharacterized protein n=1 Tax=Hydrogenovibrio crunogenus (strain DSM 25203 / XCL-2) TaxID=317025 RepID=Q31GX4_HYDCU